MGHHAAYHSALPKYTRSLFFDKPLAHHVPEYRSKKSRQTRKMEWIKSSFRVAFPGVNFELHSSTLLLENMESLGYFLILMYIGREIFSRIMTSPVLEGW